MANIEIGGRLHSTATGNVVTGANEVLDDNKNKKQSDINAETDTSLADRYTKAETYNKTELNNMITTPNQQYVTVDAYASLPATGSKDTVYRVSNYNGTTGQVDASVYSEYAWNGSSYVHLSTKTKIGEVFDISAYHATGGTLATYADLSAALDSNNGGGVPQSLQKGGMSVKFVQSSDNKYVQYRLMDDDWSTTISDWQGVDDEPIAGSHNLVESGSTFNRCENIDIAIGLVVNEDTKDIAVGSLYNNQVAESTNCLYNKNYIEVVPNKVYQLSLADGVIIRVTECDENKNYIRDTGSYAALKHVTIGSTTKYVRLSASYSQRGYGSSNPITVDAFQEGDFAILLPVATKVMPEETIKQWDDDIKEATTGLKKIITVTAGEHSSKKDIIPCFIEAGKRTGIALKNITTSNSGIAGIFVMYEGDSSLTNISVNVNFDHYASFTLNRNAVAIGLYWNAISGSTSGDIEVSVFYSSAISNRLNTVAYINEGADFEFTDGALPTIKLNANLTVKHVGSAISFTRSDILSAASAATGFTVNQEAYTIKFPGEGTMYYDTETRTVGFKNNTAIVDDSRYVVLFAAHYASAKYGLLIDYALRMKYNSFKYIDNLKQDYALSVDGVHVVSITSSDDQKYYPVTLKQGIYYLYNYGSKISSMYLCSSIDNHQSNRVITVGEVPANSVVQINCNADNIVCVDGYWPKNTDFVIVSEESLYSVSKLVSQKTTLDYIGNNNSIVSKFLPVCKNSTYRIIPNKTIWPIVQNTESWNVVGFEIKVNGVQQYIRPIRPGASSFSPIDEFIDVKIPNTNDVGFIQISLRAALNEEVSFDVVNITAISPKDTIFSTNPVEEFVPKIQTLKKKTPYGYSPTNTPLVLLWFSDIHADWINLQRINLWKSKYASYIDDVLNDGDTIANTLASYDTEMNAYFNDYDGANILLAMGNHDVTTPNSDYKAWDGTQSIPDMYSKYIGRLNANTLGITQPANAATNGYCFYYKDYVGLGISTSGIRLIVIDSCITDTDYMTEQIAWFEDTLAGAKTLGYGVVVASHYTPGGCDEFENAKGFAFINSQYRSSIESTADSRFADAIDDFIEAGGEFVTWICGHTHADHVGTVPSHPNQMIIVITTACSGSIQYEASAILPVRAANTKAQDAFNHIEFDTYNKQVKLVRVGYNVDALGREINMITLDYQNKKVII